MLADEVARHGIEGLILTVDENFSQSFDFAFEDASAVWLVGCWPPERYTILSGRLQIPKGRVKLQAPSLEVEITFADVTVSFTDLRVDLECHGNDYTLSSIGAGKGNDPLDPSVFSVSGQITTSCPTRRKGVWLPVLEFLPCLLLKQNREQKAVDRLIDRLPEILSAVLASVHSLRIGAGCPLAMHSIVYLSDYPQKECCEAGYAVDAKGCLIGGQFNGRPDSSGNRVIDVQCQSNADGKAWSAKCTTLPGGYTEVSPGVCHESEKGPAPWTCSWCSLSSDKYSDGLHKSLLAAFLLQTAIVGFFCSFTCGFCGCLMRIRMCCSY
jgi:hypothetical protein